MSSNFGTTGIVQAGQSAPINPVLVGGSNGGVLRPIAVNAAGELITAGGGGIPTGVPSDNFANPASAGIVFALGGVWDGANWDRLRGDSTGGVFVQGPVAHSGIYAGNPVLVGGFASQAAPASVTAGDAVRAWYGLAGQTIIGTGDGFIGIDGVSNNVLAALQTSNSLYAPLITAGYVFDGANWNRARGNTIAPFAQGGIAIDSPISTMFPLFMGGRANNERPAEVSADNDVQAVWLNRAGAVRVTPEVSDTADILTGIISHTATTAATTIITIPAGRTWRGSITISVDVAVAAASAVAGQALGEVSIAGSAGSFPPAGTYWRCEATAGANAATGTVGSQAANSITIPNVEITAQALTAATIQVASTITGTNGRVDAMATGSLID